MLRKVIKTTDYDGKPTDVVAYFNLSKMECTEINFEYEEEGGLVEYLKKMIQTQKANPDSMQKQSIDFVRMLVERAYGVRPLNDPSQFIKEDENGQPLYKKFKRTPAYDTYVFGLLSGEESFEEFMECALPKLNDEQKVEAEKLLKSEGLAEALPEAATEG